MAPNITMVRHALAFSDGLPNEARLLIHCRHGISRSPAVALAVLCQHYPSASEKKMFETVLKIRPHASPNRLIVDLADKLLRRKGRMSEALQNGTGT